jgi:DNA repair exonuclease SbcCD ATPase subunit
MDESKQLALFDYGTLDLDTRSFVQTKTAEIRILVKQTAQGIIEIGQRLIEVKEKLGHGNWLPWLEGEFGWNEQTARNFMNVARNFPQIQNNFGFQLRALYLLSAPSTPESAREEALSLAESGEKISHAKAQEIIAKHKAEAEAAKNELKIKQQVLTTLEDQINSLEAERTKLRAEHNRAILTKQADDACIIRQEEIVEKLNQQIEELKAKVAQPQVIEKEVEKVIEVEKVVEVVKAPDDYEQLKSETEYLKGKLNTARQKAGEELAEYQNRIKDLSVNLAKKEEMLKSFDSEQKQFKALGKLNEGLNCLNNAYGLLGGEIINQPRIKDTINNYLQTYQQILTKFLDKNNTIDTEAIEVEYV